MKRLSRLRDGRLLYGLRQPWRDGTTRVAFLPLELKEKLAALVPMERDTESKDPSTATQPLGTETAKPDLRPRNVLACPECGGRMRMLSAVHSPAAIQAILESLFSLRY
jgi:hypothetical protein